MNRPTSQHATSSHSVSAPGTGLQLDLIQDSAVRTFLSAFLAAGGTFSPLISLTSIESQGNCCVANDDIEEGCELFSIPRNILFNTTTCPLAALCRQKEQGDPTAEAKGDNDMSIDEEPDRRSPAPAKKWDELTGWTPLIISMMWASVHSQDVPEINSTTSTSNALWSAYFSVLPTDFSHLPMFWSEEEVRELRGTAVPERIGKEEADEEYRNVVVPFITSRPDIFFPGGANLSKEEMEAKVEEAYGLDHFHIQGSRILSRSFHVKRQGTKEVLEGRMVDVEESADIADEESDRSEDEEEDEEREDTGDISMVPMADMLNASYASENARLFYTPTSLCMRAVSPIKRGEQILNTYGDPPNSDLLRRYGHVDAVNGADEVELSAKLLVEACLRLPEIASESKDVDPSTFAPLEEQKDALTKRVEHCIAHAGLEESFVLSYIFPLNPRESTIPKDIINLTDTEVSSVIEEGRCSFFEDEELQSLCRALLMEEEEWQTKYEQKGKVPKPKMGLQVAELLHLACLLREKMYPSSEAGDGAPTAQDETTSPRSSLNVKNAAVVRRGEKAVLRQNRDLLQKWSKLQQQQQRLRQNNGCNGTSNSDTRKRKEHASAASSSNNRARGPEGRSSAEEAGKRAKR